MTDWDKLNEDADNRIRAVPNAKFKYFATHVAAFLVGAVIGANFF